MELIDKKKIYKEIKRVEQKYHKTCCNDMDTATYRTYQRFLADLANIRDFIENEEADIVINDKIFNTKEEHKCIKCGGPVNLPFGLCKTCRDKAGEQKDAYVKFIMENKNNEK